jgi:glucuronate isomerase
MFANYFVHPPQRRQCQLTRAIYLHFHLLQDAPDAGEAGDGCNRLVKCLVRFMKGAQIAAAGEETLARENIVELGNVVFARGRGGALGSQLLERLTDRRGLWNGGDGNARDECAGLWKDVDKPNLGQANQSFAQRRAANAETVRQGLFGERRAGRQLHRNDRLAQFLKKRARGGDARDRPAAAAQLFAPTGRILRRNRHGRMIPIDILIYHLMVASKKPAMRARARRSALLKKGACVALHPDRLLPIEPDARAIARRLYESVAKLPIVSPHGHTDPRWYADDAPFPDPATLFVKPDHYVFRMLYSQRVSLEDLGVTRTDGGPVETDGRKIWRLFARHWSLFRGTPTRLWFEDSLERVFGIEERLNESNADRLYDVIAQKLLEPDFRPRALYRRFNIEAIATTDSPLDDLVAHYQILASIWNGRVLPTYRPDFVVDPGRAGFQGNVEQLLALAGEGVTTYAKYLAAHRIRRAYFKARGATATDHGHPTCRTADLPAAEAAALFDRVMGANASPEDRELFRAQMLTEMARMSIEDGLVMQIHPGSLRNHNPAIFRDFGPDMGADIPTSTDYVRALKPLLDAHGADSRLTIILFTLDETTYGRELAPLAGHYPVLRLGPPWWFFDSPEGMRRFREMTTETAGFANTVGFNDDTRAYLSIPARHDMARRCDCAFLARLVADHRLDEDETYEVAYDLAYGLAKKAYRLWAEAKREDAT